MIGINKNSLASALAPTVRRLIRIARNTPAEAIERCDVVIPYHRQNLCWLRSSIESILNQVNVDCVVHLVADGFSDVSDPALEFADHPLVRWYRNDTCIGPYRTLHRIFSRLETSYIALQDSDDIALPHRLETSFKSMRRQNAEIFCAAMRQFVSFEDRNDTSLKRQRREPVLYPGQISKLTPNGRIINGTLLIAAAAFHRLNGFLAIHGGADLEFSTRSKRAGLKIVMSKEVLGLRRLHSGSLSRSVMHGTASAEREKHNASIILSYCEMTPGFDPRRFGGLRADLDNAHKTIRLNNVSKGERYVRSGQHAG